jgi:tetrahydromethanopterin S-methyltransferase subunit G
MDPAVFLVPVGSIVAIIAAVYVAQAKIIRLRATLPESPLADATARLQALEDLQVRLAELDQLKQRISELEERVDFAERLLTTQREGQRLGPPQD